MKVFIDAEGIVRSRIVNEPQGVSYEGYEVDPADIPPRPELGRGETAELHYDPVTGIFTYYVKERPLNLVEKNEVFEKSIQITTREMVRQDQLTQAELEDLVFVYPEWSGAGVAYAVGDIVRYRKNLFEVIQAHTSQADWDPVIATSLFKNKMPDGIIPEWTQPTGSHDAYMTGDKVIFEGQVYRSLIDANTWSPTEYPSGWELVE